MPYKGKLTKLLTRTGLRKPCYKLSLKLRRTGFDKILKNLEVPAKVEKYFVSFCLNYNSGKGDKDCLLVLLFQNGLKQKQPKKKFCGVEKFRTY